VTAEIVVVVIVTAGLLYLWGLSVPGLNGPNRIFDGPFTEQWLQIVLISLVARGVLQALVFARGRWTVPLAWANALLALAFALPIIVIALSGKLVDSYYAVGIGWPDLPNSAGLPMLLVVAGTTFWSLWEIGRAFQRAGASGSVRSILLPSRHAT
jgi:hypothetical protein